MEWYHALFPILIMIIYYQFKQKISPYIYLKLIEVLFIQFVFLLNRIGAVMVMPLVR
jgi:hypothetical protein